MSPCHVGLWKLLGKKLSPCGKNLPSNSLHQFEEKNSISTSIDQSPLFCVSIKRIGLLYFMISNTQHPRNKKCVDLPLHIYWLEIYLFHELIE